MKYKKRYILVSTLLLCFVIWLFLRGVFYYNKYGLCLHGGIEITELEWKKITDVGELLPFRYPGVAYGYLDILTYLIIPISLFTLFFLKEKGLKVDSRKVFYGAVIVCVLRIILEIYILNVKTYPEYFRALKYLPLYALLFLTACSIKKID